MPWRRVKLVSVSLSDRAPSIARTAPSRRSTTASCASRAGDTRVDDGLRLDDCLLVLCDLEERFRRAARRFALPGHGGLGFLQFFRQGLRLEPFGIEVRGSAIALGGDQCLHACALTFDLGARALALGGQRLGHFFPEPRRRVRRRLFQLLAEARGGMRGGLLHLGAELRGRRAGGLLHVVADLLADALGRLGHRPVGFKTDAVGLRHQALFGIRRRVGHTGLEPTLPLFAKRLGFLSLAVGGFSRRTGQTLELESAALGFGSHAFLGLSGGRGHAGLEPTLPLFAKRLDFRSVPVGGFSGRLGETIRARVGRARFRQPPVARPQRRPRPRRPGADPATLGEAPRFPFGAKRRLQPPPC